MKTNFRGNLENGFSLIELLIVVTIIGIIAAIAVPNLMMARRASNEASAVSSLSLIYRSEVTYKTTTGGGEYTDISTLYNANFLDEVIGVTPHIKSGYSFEVDIFPSTSTMDARLNVRARPVSHSSVNIVTGTGGKDFGINEASSIFKTVDNTAVSFDDITRLPTGSATPIDGS